MRRSAGAGPVRLPFQLRAWHADSAARNPLARLQFGVAGVSSSG